MPIDVSNIVTLICGVYSQLVWLAPYVATLIIALALAVAILFRTVAVGTILLSVLIALIIDTLPHVLGMLGMNQLPCGH